MTICWLLSGCQIAQQKTPLPEGQLYRGLLVPEQGYYRFTPCYSQTSYIVDDRSGQLDRINGTRIARQPTLYAELSAIIPPEGDKLVLERLELAGGPAALCNQHLEQLRYRAAAGDGRWLIDIDRQRLRLHLTRQGRVLQFPAEARAMGQAELRWQGEIVAGQTYRLALRLIDGGCFDPSGAYFRYRAELQLNGERSSGCARAGRLLSRSLVGRYRLVLDDRPVEAFLHANGELSLVSAATEGYWGRWQTLGENKLLLTLQQSNGQRLLIFSADRNRRWQLRGESRGELSWLGPLSSEYYPPP
ncbi:hypothetical protein [Marinobacterium arenosum]|uniref:hypothetical protein n=1 Tax=Marinobacterium arenosum TaxID=2862496 RepID=UPI001C96204D|nr:hypothetical protein [Marinobacterium arenosum]MBY4678496.1 hypothetical protein [Marinobacterium arenosum]